MNLQPHLRQKYWSLKRAVADGMLRSGVELRCVFVSSNKLFLSMMYGCATYKRSVLGLLPRAGKLLLA